MVKTPEDVLAHFGVLGMKWGVRKEREAAYRQKLSAISKNKSVQGTSDERRFAYRNKPLPVRARKMLTGAIVQTIAQDVLSGKVSTYASMSKKDIAKKIAKITALTAANVTLEDSLARSASKRYTTEGKRVKGTKDRLLNKEDTIQRALIMGFTMAPILGSALKIKASQVSRTRAQNEANFNKWGANILPERVDHVIWQSPDLSTAIIDNIRR